MRIRRKKHLLERISQTRDNLFTADYQIKNVLEANKEKRYLDFEKIFQNTNQTELEIGCGKGGFIIEKAKSFPSINYLAVELIDNIIIMGAENASAENLNNVKFFNCGAEYLPKYIKPHSIETIYLNFSPPFNGKRYENRRLTNPRLIKDYREYLVNNGKIIQKTDDKDFFDYSFNCLENSGFSVVDCSESGIENDVLTEYEKKFLEKKLPIYKLTAIKKGD